MARRQLLGSRRLFRRGVVRAERTRLTKRVRQQLKTLTFWTQCELMKQSIGCFLWKENIAASKSKRSRREFFKNNIAVNEKAFPSDEFEVLHVIEWAEIDEENHLSRQKIDTYKNMFLLSKEVHKEITRKTNSSRASNRWQYGVTPIKFYKVEIYDDIWLCIS